MQNQVKGIIFTAVPACDPCRQIPNAKERTGADSGMIVRQVFTDVRRRKLANWILEANCLCKGGRVSYLSVVCNSPLSSGRPLNAKILLSGHLKLNSTE